MGGTISYLNPVSADYKADGPNALIDGIRGTSNISKSWHGFAGQDLVATIDLGAEKNISKISLGCLQNYHDWIFLPQSVKYEISLDGKSFSEVKTISNTVPTSEPNIIKDFSVEFSEQKAKFVRVTGKILNGCPKGHPGEGKAAWIFSDEIVIE